MRLLFGVVASLVLLVAGSWAAQIPPVDYTVYIQPEAPRPPDTFVVGALKIEKRYAVIFNVGPTPGTHSHKLVLKAFAPDGSLACETTATVKPWTGRNTVRRVAVFEAGYWPAGWSEKDVKAHWPDAVVPLPRVVPGDYQLHVYLTEIIPPGEQLQDSPNGNEWPVPAPTLIPQPLTVGPTARAIRCAEGTGLRGLILRPGSGLLDLPGMSPTSRGY